MKTPPFLLFATLLFWGWQSDFLWAGAAMGALLESSRFTKFRWDLDDADFNRIWSFCVLLNVALIAYAVTNHGLGGGAAGNPVLNAVNSGSETATRFLRWLPMTTFAFLAAQVFNARPSVPLTAVSLVLRWRRRHGDRAFAGQYHDISYAYFLVCVFAAGVHQNNGSPTYFLGLGVLAAWVLWAIRPRRFKFLVWLAALVLVAGIGLAGVFGINRAQIAIQRFNAQWIARIFGSRTDPLQSMTSMGRIGQMKLSPKIVIWLEPHEVGNVPEYLREASYRNYQPQTMTWSAGSTMNDFALIQPESDNTSWVLVPDKKAGASVNVTCYLNGRSRDGDHEGVLPLPSGSSRLENLPSITSVIALQKNPNGTVLATGNGLMIFDARFGPGATMDAPPEVQFTNHSDLTVPSAEFPAVAQVVAELNLPAGASDAVKEQAVKKLFLDKFTYSVWQGLTKRATTNASPLTKFLLTSRSGHCEYFATAAVLLLRQLQIPARYAVGYYVHETRGSGYVVRERDAHAWCLAWNAANHCWEDFDGTPPSWVAIESGRTSFGEWFSDLRSWLGLQFAKFRWGRANLQQYILWVLVPVMLVLLYHIIFRRRGKLAARGQDGAGEAVRIWPGLDSEFYQLEKRLAARGLPRQPGEALTDWLERMLQEPALAEQRAPLLALLQLHYRHRFDPAGLDAAGRARLRNEAKAQLDTLARRG